MLEANKVELQANGHLPHWKEDAISSSLARSPPTGKEPVKVLLQALTEGGRMKQPSQLFWYSGKASVGKPRGTKRSPLPLHFSATPCCCLRGIASNFVNFDILYYQHRLGSFSKVFLTPTKRFPTLSKTAYRMLKPVHFEKTWALPLCLITERSQLLLAQHTVQLQYYSSIIFSVLRHLRDICKTCLVPSSQAGGIKQNQHGSDGRASHFLAHELPRHYPNPWSLINSGLLFVPYDKPNNSKHSSSSLPSNLTSCENSRGCKIKAMRLKENSLFTLSSFFSTIVLLKKVVLQTISFLFSNLRKTRIPQL